MSALLARVWPHALVACLCLGLAASVAVRGSSPLVAAAAAAVGLGAAAAHARLRLASLALALLLAGWWWGSVRLDGLDGSTLAAFEGDSARTVAVVTGPARRGAFALRIPAEVKRFGRLLPDEDVLLLLPLGRAPPQGAILELAGRIELPRTSDDGFDERAWLRRRGVSVVVEATSWRLVGARGGIGGIADRLRSHLERSVAPALGGERKAVIAGVVYGADEGLSPELQDAFRASGLYHLLAVSGQNVGFIAAGVAMLAWLVGASRRLSELAVLVAIAAYVLAVGWQPSVVRAGVAGALTALAWLAARERDRWYALLVGAVVLLAWNPYTLLEPGFQLSFTAVAAIFVVVPRLLLKLEGYPLPHKAAATLAVSAACGVATAPVVWLHFGAVPVYSVPANALAAPAVPPLLGLGLASAVVEPLVPAVAAALAEANGWLAAYVAGCARVVGELPGAQTSSPATLGLLAAAIAIVVVAARLDHLRRRRLLSGALAAAVALAAWQLLPDDAAPAPRGLRITVLDVGQGDSTLIETPDGAVLVDEGPPEARVAEQLERRGIERLALLVLSHPSRDNIGGAEDVVARLDVELLLHAALPFDDPFGRPALAEARRRGTRIGVARTGSVYALGRARIRVLWPPDGERRSDDANDHATVLLVTYGQVDALLPADAESNVLLPLRLPPVEVLKVSHHGSADPGLPELLERIRPEVAIVSVGEGNDYGHPTPSTLAALSDARLYRTDRDGAVTLESDGTELTVRSER